MKDIEEYVPADASESGEAAADQRHIGRILLFGAIFALLVGAAIAIAVIFPIDRSYRYDLEDLSPFFKEGAVIDYAGLNSLPISLESGLNETDILDKIEENLKSLDAIDAYVEKDADLSVNSPYPDIVRMYYEIYRADEFGQIIDTTPILSNTGYWDSSKATEVRLGSGDLHILIENYMRNHPEYGTTVIRNEDRGDAIGEGYTRVIDLTITYEKPNSSGDGTTIANYLTLTSFNLEVGDCNIDEKREQYYVGATDFCGVATEVKDHYVPRELSDLLMEEFASLTQNGDAFSTVYYAKLEPGSNEVTDLRIEGKVVASFLAETKRQIFRIGEQYIPNEAGDGFVQDVSPIDFTYKDAAGTTQRLDKSSCLLLNVTVEGVVRLNKETVLALTADETAFVPPTELGENEDHAYAAQYTEYVKKTILNENAYKKKQDAEAFASEVKNALWQEIIALYATDGYIVSFPEGEIEKYCEAMIEAYEAEFESSGLAYCNVTEYVLVRIFEVSDVSKMDAAEQERVLNEKLTAKAEESIRKQILLFWLGDYYNVEITKADTKAAEEEIYNAYYSTYLSLYTSYYSTVYSKSDIARLARQDAKAQAEAICTPAYLREYVALTEVQNALVRDAANYPNVTWTLEKAPEPTAMSSTSSPIYVGNVINGIQIAPSDVNYEAYYDPSSSPVYSYDTFAPVIEVEYATPVTPQYNTVSPSPGIGDIKFFPIP